MQRVCRPVLGFDGPARRHERLGEHLSPEDPARADIPVLPAVDVPLDRLEVEEIDQIPRGVAQGKLSGGTRRRVACSKA